MHSISGGCASLVNYLVTTVANKKAGVPVSSAADEDEKTKTKTNKKNALSFNSANHNCSIRLGFMPLLPRCAHGQYVPCVSL